MVGSTNDWTNCLSIRCVSGGRDVSGDRMACRLVAGSASISVLIRPLSVTTAARWSPSDTPAGGIGTPSRYERGKSDIPAVRYERCRWTFEDGEDAWKSTVAPGRTGSDQASLGKPKFTQSLTGKYPHRVVLCISAEKCGAVHIQPMDRDLVWVCTLIRTGISILGLPHLRS